jgi:hypothetical protein
MPVLSNEPVDPAPRYLPVLVAIAVLIVLAGLASLHSSAVTPAGAELERLL